jgi:hypothetical protein
VKTYAVALVLAGAFAVSAATPSFAKTHTIAQVDVGNVRSAHQGFAYEPALGRFAPGFTGYGRMAYNPEQPTDPDPRIGGALKMSTDR